MIRYRVKICNWKYLTLRFCAHDKLLSIWLQDLESTGVICESNECKQLHTNIRIPLFSKIYGRVMYKRLYNYIILHDILYNDQVGFRETHSPYMALMTLIDYLLEASEMSKAANGLFSDVLKAFDTVDHWISHVKLHRYGVWEVMLDRFRGYISDHIQWAIYDYVSSEIMPVKYGVSQGSILGDLLFLIPTNYLPNAAAL